MSRSNHKNYDSSAADIKDRVKYLIDMSRLTQGSFARRISMDPANLSKVLSGNLKMSDTFINRLVVELGISKRWLTTGEGVPFEKARGHEIERFTNPSIVDVPIQQGAPIYDIDFTAGFSELSRELTQERIVGYVDFPRLNPRSIVVRVSGDSMDPDVPDGSMIAIRQVRTDGIISWGDIYAVQTEDYRMVKYLRKNPDKNFITLHSANPNYDDIDLPRKDILGLYYIDAILRYKLQ